MRKLKLNLDDLAIDTFSVSHEPGPGDGTVQGLNGPFGGIASHYTENVGSCDNTCTPSICDGKCTYWQTCNHTRCGATCPPDHTCDPERCPAISADTCTFVEVCGG